VDTGRDRDLLKQYQELARASAPDVIFAGRLGNYRYYDMDDTIAAALDLFESLRARR
jgi:UDP-galactopyranose mutase